MLVLIPNSNETKYGIKDTVYTVVLYFKDIWTLVITQGPRLWRKQGTQALHVYKETRI